MKRCCKCGLTKNSAEFNKNRAQPDGLEYTCKPCLRVIRKLGIGRDGLTIAQRRATKVGKDGLTYHQRQAQRDNEGRTLCKRQGAEIGEDGLTKNQRNALKIGTNGLTYNQRRYAKNPGKGREYRLKAVYNITAEEFDRMLKSQNNACAICKATDRKMCVDHNHSTGKLRALLCFRCNTGIGMLGDSVLTVTAAAEYLVRYAETTP